MGNCWQRPEKKQEFFRNPSGIAGWAQVYEQKDRIIFIKNPDRSRIKKNFAIDLHNFFFNHPLTPRPFFFNQTLPYESVPSPRRK